MWCVTFYADVLKYRFKELFYQYDVEDNLLHCDNTAQRKIVDKLANHESSWKQWNVHKFLNPNIRCEKLE